MYYPFRYSHAFSYPRLVIIYPDWETDWLVAECPEIGTASQGHTEEEALANLREATELYLESFPHALKKPAAVRTFELAHA